MLKNPLLCLLSSHSDDRPCAPSLPSKVVPSPRQAQSQTKEPTSRPQAGASSDHHRNRRLFQTLVLMNAMSRFDGCGLFLSKIGSGSGKVSGGMRCFVPIGPTMATYSKMMQPNNPTWCVARGFCPMFVLSSVGSSIPFPWLRGTLVNICVNFPRFPCFIDIEQTLLTLPLRHLTEFHSNIVTPNCHMFLLYRNTYAPDTMRHPSLYVSGRGYDSRDFLVVTLRSAIRHRRSRFAHRPITQPFGRWDPKPAAAEVLCRPSAVPLRKAQHRCCVVNVSGYTYTYTNACAGTHIFVHTWIHEPEYICMMLWIRGM